MKLPSLTTRFTLVGLLFWAAYASAAGKTTPAAEAIATVPQQTIAGSAASPFNRLLKPPAKSNLAPMEDGIHDPANDGTQLLQPPLDVFTMLPKSNAGNRVDWVKSLNEAKIKPRHDLTDPDAQAIVMDLDIVREVKGSMPNVVYPHKQHTEWLDCSNCHPAIFIPQKGGNQISMAAILLGQKCGVCHGKVAFPVSECRLCHSQKKQTTAGNP
jgi:c(7)-type cytochrome triheme protein